MSLHDDECLLADIAAALGETIALVRNRGFHIDSRSVDYGSPITSSRCRRDANDDDDAVDFAAFGLDWDAGDDFRPRYRPRRLTARRIRRRVA